MKTDALADHAVASTIEALTREGRKVVTPASTQPSHLPLHLGLWGPGKSGKSYLALSARTSEVRTKDKVENFKVVERGSVVIPSKPLSIAYANFDRDAATVYKDLNPDIQIIEEEFYQQNGELIIPVFMKPADFEQMFQRLHRFIDEAEAAGVELFVLDGGTVIWEEVREWKLPKGEVLEGKERAGVRPAQYNSSNTTMRTRVMQRLYGMQNHTICIREASEVWQSAGEKAYEADGSVKMKADGWNKTGHYIDLDVQMRLIQEGRTATPREVSLSPGILDKPISSPSFAKLYGAVFGRPLLKEEDQETWDRDREDLSWN